MNISRSHNTHVTEDWYFRPFRGLTILLILVFASSLQEFGVAQSAFEIPIYPSRQRYEEDTYGKVRGALAAGERQRLIDLIDTDPLVCRSALIRLLRAPGSLEQAREFASLFPMGSTSPIEESLVEFFTSASTQVRSELLDSFETLIDLQIALGRTGFNDRLSREIGS